MSGLNRKETGMNKFRKVYTLLMDYEKCVPPQVDFVELANYIAGKRWSIHDLGEFLYQELGGKAWGWGDGEAEDLARLIILP
jgi:hypothetical protein